MWIYVTDGREDAAMNENLNRREFTRVSVHMEVEVAATEVAVINGHLQDVNMSGLFLLCDTLLPIGTPCRVVLRLGSQEDETCIEVSGRIVRTQDEGMAIEFTEILGLDSFGHLRNLVLYNSAAWTDQVEEELQSHVGIRRRP